jgi:hypothetical protein
MVDRWYTFHLLYLYMSHFIGYFIYTVLYILTSLWRGRPSLSGNRVSIFVFLEELDDGHNRPKLVAQNLQIKTYSHRWLWRIFCDNWNIRQWGYWTLNFNFILPAVYRHNFLSVTYLYHTGDVSYQLHSPHVSNPNTSRWRVQIMPFLIIWFCPAFFFPLKSKFLYTYH